MRRSWSKCESQRRTIEQTKRVENHEQSPSSSRHKKRRVHPHVGWHAQRWKVSGPHFAGWEIYHLKGSPVDPNRIYASQTSGWFGQIIQRSDDGGKTWKPPGAAGELDNARRHAERRKQQVRLRHVAETGNRHTISGTTALSIRGNSNASGIWNRRCTDPDTVYAGVEDAALFKSTDGGKTWQELSGLRGSDTGPQWQPGAGGMCLHTILLDPKNPNRIFIAISAAGAFRTDDGGKTWKPINEGLHSQYNSRSERRSRPLRASHRHASVAPETLFMQKHWDVMRSDDAGDSWHEVSGNLPTDFGFPIDVHAHEPETIYVVPIKSDSEHFPPDGKLRVYRSRTGGNEWEALTQRSAAKGLLRERPARRDVRSTRSTRAAFTSAPPAARFTPRRMAATPGKRSCATCPAVLSVEVQTLP